MRATRGFFIVFDGIDGCGKSTQLELAAARLVQDGFRVVKTREPGGTGISEKIRDLILSPDNSAMVRECELLLYAASRAQHVGEKIKSELEQGAVVVCDRFDCATYAYQGFGRNIPLKLLKSINRIASAGLTADCTFVFDISVESAFKRLSSMEKTRDRLESNDNAFFSRVAKGYRTLARRNPGVIVLLDAELPASELGEMVYGRIRKMIQEKRL